MEKKETQEVEKDICAACGYDMKGAIHCPCCGTGIWLPDMPYWSQSVYGKNDKEGNK